MKCIYHTDRQAISICAYCGRGLCEECAVDVDEFVVCGGHCEGLMRTRLAENLRVREVTMQMEQHMKTASANGRIAAITGVVLGLLLLIFGWGAETVQTTLLLLSTGAATTAAGTAFWWNWRRTRKG